MCRIKHEAEKGEKKETAPKSKLVIIKYLKSQNLQISLFGDLRGPADQVDKKSSLSGVHNLEFTCQEVLRTGTGGLRILRLLNPFLTSPFGRSGSGGCIRIVSLLDLSNLPFKHSHQKLLSGTTTQAGIV